MHDDTPMTIAERRTYLGRSAYRSTDNDSAPARHGGSATWHLERATKAQLPATAAPQHRRSARSRRADAARPWRYNAARTGTIIS